MRRNAALLARAAAVTLLVLAGTLVGGPAQASPIARCSATRGTIVAVDFHHWGGPIVRGCDLQGPAKGINLLTDEGFTTAGDQHDGPQFLCRIGNTAFAGGTQYPTPGQDPCVVTPPSSAYWSYWLAPAGRNTWSYSQLGAYSETPKAGEVQLWIFGGTQIRGSQGSPVSGFPVCTPDSLRAGGSPTSCTPSGSSSGSAGGTSHGGSGAGRRHQHATARHATPAGSSAATSDSGRARAGASSAAARSGSATASARISCAARSSAAPTSTAPANAATTKAAPASAARSSAPPAGCRSASAAAGGAPSSGSSGVPVAVDAQPASKSITSSGSSVPLIVGLCLAALIGLAGGWTVLRRRRAGD